MVIELTEEQYKLLLSILDDWSSEYMFPSTSAELKKKVYELITKCGGDIEWLRSW